MAERNPKELARDGLLTALAWVAERRSRRHPAVAVVTYHRVAPADERPDLLPGLAVTPEHFAEQVQMFALHAEPVSLDDLLAAADGGPALPPRAVHVTFDDAYSCIEEHAWPVLRDLGVPASLYVPTRYPDQGRTFWWDRLHQAVTNHSGWKLCVDGRTWQTGTAEQRARARDDLKALVGQRPHRDAMALVDEVCEVTGCPPAEPATSSWAGLRTMASEGLAIGSHSRHHPFLDRLDPERLDCEIAGSLSDLFQQLGPAARPAIAYPGGHVDDATLAATARAGIRVGFTTSRGVAAGDQAPDWLQLPRINVGRRASAPLVRVQLRPEPHRVHDLARTAPSTRSRPGKDHQPAPRRALWN
ncbi:polysaccharide deacetylase family protein [Aquihabitans sp. McL0605]|uniref:polysaccharide deacetylase family protein n=1 Tax=Aquihabitans sp. McL0605 TaxID=3415671 RepID=UPI003CF07223